MGHAWRGLSHLLLLMPDPIIHLDELGALDVLSDFQQILVSQAVSRGGTS